MCQPYQEVFSQLGSGSQSSEDKIEKLEKIESLVSESTDKLVVEELPDLPETFSEDLSYNEGHMPETSADELPNLPETSTDDDEEFFSFNEMD